VPHLLSLDHQYHLFGFVEILELRGATAYPKAVIGAQAQVWRCGEQPRCGRNVYVQYLSEKAVAHKRSGGGSFGKW